MSGRGLRLAALLLALYLPAAAEAARRPWIRRVLLAAAAAAAAADWHSSRGGLERNPIARGPDGRFAAGRGLAIKIGIIGTLGVLQERTRWTVRWDVANGTAAAVWGAAAVHNYRVRGK